MLNDCDCGNSNRNNNNNIQNSRRKHFMADKENVIHFTLQTDRCFICQIWLWTRNYRKYITWIIVSINHLIWWISLTVFLIFFSLRFFLYIFSLIGFGGCMFLWFSDVHLHLIWCFISIGRRSFYFFINVRWLRVNTR